MTGPARITVAIVCPQCGAPLEFSEGDRNTTCEACGTSLAIAGESGIGRLVLPERIDVGRARSECRKFLATSGVNEELAKSVKFEKGNLIFLPFWRLAGDVTGWIHVKRETVVMEEYVDEQGLRQTRETQGPLEAVTEMVARPLSYSSAATNTAPFGLHGIGLASSILKLEPLDRSGISQRGSLYGISRGSDIVRREALATIKSSMAGSRVLSVDARLKISSESLSVIHYPVWRLVFRHGKRLYPVTVDAVNGRILKARFPGNIEIKVFEPLAVMACIMFCFGLHPLAGTAAVAMSLTRISSSEGELSPGSILHYLTGFIRKGQEVRLG